MSEESEQLIADNRAAMNVILHLSAAMREINKRSQATTMKAKLDAAREHLVKAIEEIDAHG